MYFLNNFEAFLEKNEKNSDPETIDKIFKLDRIMKSSDNWKVKLDAISAQNFLIAKSLIGGGYDK